MERPGFIPVGAVVKPHGIRGEFSIKSYADSPALFDAGRTLHLGTGRKPLRPVRIRTMREHKGLVLLTVDGVADRDQAELLRGLEVFILEADLPDLEDGEHYLYQMIGCRVRLEDGTDVGELAGFYETGEQDTWVIMTDENVEILLPAVPEFVLDVDLDEELIVIAPPEGLLDLYLNPEPSKKKTPRPPKTKSGKTR